MVIISDWSNNRIEKKGKVRSRKRFWGKLRNGKKKDQWSNFCRCSSGLWRCLFLKGRCSRRQAGEDAALSEFPGKSLERAYTIAQKFWHWLLLLSCCLVPAASPVCELLGQGSCVSAIQCSRECYKIFQCSGEMWKLRGHFEEGSVW